MNTRIYQIYYDKNSFEKLDKGFIPYDNTGKCTRYFENDVILDIWKNKREEWINEDFVGVLSWRFFEKTKITSLQLKTAINTENSIYLLTPNIYLSYDASFSRLGYEQNRIICAEMDKVNLLNFKTTDFDKNCKCFCNFFILNPRIFNEYVSTCLIKVKTYLETTNNPKVINALKIPIRHRGMILNSAVFLMEGLFHYWLFNHKYSYKYILPKNTTRRPAIEAFYEKNAKNIITI